MNFEITWYDEDDGMPSDVAAVSIAALPEGARRYAHRRYPHPCFPVSIYSWQITDKQLERIDMLRADEKFHRFVRYAKRCARHRRTA